MPPVWSAKECKVGVGNAVDHAMSNPNERSHRSLLDLMRVQMELQADHAAWPRAVLFAVMALSSMDRDPLRMSAAVLVFGRHNRCHARSDVERALARRL